MNVTKPLWFQIAKVLRRTVSAHRDVLKRESGWLRAPFGCNAVCSV
jgi:hypothetical protein